MTTSKAPRPSRNPGILNVILGLLSPKAPQAIPDNENPAILRDHNRRFRKLGDAWAKEPNKDALRFLEHYALAHGTNYTQLYVAIGRLRYLKECAEAVIDSRVPVTDEDTAMIDLIAALQGVEVIDA